MHRLATRSLMCTGCGEAMEVRTGDWENPLRLRALRRAMTQEHEACERYEGDPERARAERVYRQGMAVHAAELKR